MKHVRTQCGSLKVTLESIELLDQVGQHHSGALDRSSLPNPSDQRVYQLRKVVSQPCRFVSAAERHSVDSPIKAGRSSSGRNSCAPPTNPIEGRFSSVPPPSPFTSHGSFPAKLARYAIRRAVSMLGIGINELATESAWAAVRRACGKSAQLGGSGSTHRKPVVAQPRRRWQCMLGSSRPVARDA